MAAFIWLEGSLECNLKKLELSTYPHFALKVAVKTDE